MCIRDRTHILCLWGEEKLSLCSIDGASRRFFVRAKKGCEEEAKKLFGEIEMVDAGLFEEFGFVTPSLTEKAFAEKCGALSGFISRIRVEGD